MLLPLIGGMMLIKGSAARQPMSLLLWGITFGRSETRLEQLQSEFVAWFRQKVRAFPVVQQRLTEYLHSPDADVWLITGSPQPLEKSILIRRGCRK
ncbi:HAD hydrolase, family IF [Cedecea neteri]|uniref:HAD hydrolase, family IF n=1 Tax=Cedecea neteri TaxID=158822 RepID=A0A2X2SW99_9ENTR|nr:HAD hydrolase, family IF [Cedecea neteri]